MIATALAGVVIAALGAIAYIAHIENKHDDERDGCERLPRTPGTAPRARHGRQEQGRQGREEGAEAASGRQPERAHEVRPARVVEASARGLENVPGPVPGSSPESRTPAGPGTTSVRRAGDTSPSGLARTAASDPAMVPGETPGRHPECAHETAGSEACEACTANQCPAGCKCSCHWGAAWHDTDTIAAVAFGNLAAIPGWGDDGWVDLEAEGFATDDLLAYADRMLRVPEVIA